MSKRLYLYYTTCSCWSNAIVNHMADLSMKILYLLFTELLNI